MLRKWICAAAVPVLALWAAAGHADATIQAFEPDSLERIVTSQSGKPFVLVVWSLDCAYCQASMHVLAQEKRKRKNLNVVTLSTDSVEDTEAASLMKKRLEALGMLNNAWAFGEAAPEQLRYAVDPRWRGEKPRSYWFNAEGKSVAHSGAITPAVIAKFAALQAKK